MTTAGRMQVLWITPLRALANDTCEQLQGSADALGAELRVEVRTGDTSSSRRSKQRGDPPFALITTPESLSVMLSYANADKSLRKVNTVVVDEWHELLGRWLIPSFHQMVSIFAGRAILACNWLNRLQG